METAISHGFVLAATVGLLAVLVFQPIVAIVSQVKSIAESIGDKAEGIYSALAGFAQKVKEGLLKIWNWVAGSEGGGEGNSTGG